MLSKFSFFEFPYWIRGILFEGKTSWEKVGFRIKRPQKFNEIFQLNWNLHSCSKFKIAVVEIMESKIYYFTLKDDSYYSGNSWMVFNVPTTHRIEVRPNVPVRIPSHSWQRWCQAVPWSPLHYCPELVPGKSKIKSKN